MVISRLGSAALISRDGQVYTWGANSIGELGHGDRLPRQEPTLVKSIGKVTAISLGNEFCIALGNTLSLANSTGFDHSYC